MKKLFILISILVILVFGCICYVCSSKGEHVEGPVWADAQHNYVYFGEYPQTEVKGKELTSKIKNAEYDENGVATLGDKTYVRLNGNEVFHNHYLEVGNVSEEYFDWSDNEAHYFICEPILWRVIDKEEGTITLLSEFCLENQPFNIWADTQIVWNKSTVRSWLNAYEAKENTAELDFTKKGFSFISQAFSEEEQSLLLKTLLLNTDNLHYDVDGSEETNDYVFLISQEELDRDGFSDVSQGTRYVDRVAHVTDYARAMGAATYLVDGNRYGVWWTRTEGGEAGKMVCVESDGSLLHFGESVTNRNIALRPVIRVKESDVQEAKKYREIKLQLSEVNDEREGVLLRDVAIAERSATGIIEIVDEADSLGNMRTQALKLEQALYDDNECYVDYSLDKAYRKFKATVSYGEMGDLTEVFRLRIIVDGKEKYCSEEITANTEPFDISVSVSKGEVMRVVWEGDGVTPQGSLDSGAVLLVNAVLTK